MSEGERVTPSPEEMQAAYARLLPALDAETEETLRTLDLPLSDAAITALKAYKRLVAWHEPMLQVTPPDRHEYITRLPDYAAAALQAEALATAATASRPKTTKNLRAEGLRLRQKLLVHADALVEEDYFDPAAVAAVRAGPQSANKEISKDLFALAELFEGRWEAIRDNTSVRREQLAEARETAAQLRERAAVDPEPPPPTEAQRRRTAAFTLLHRAYEENRRAIQHARYYERDADQIAPSLYAGLRGGQRSRSTSIGSTEPTPEQPIEV